MAKDLWLYPVIAVPLTLLVLFVWISWRRRQIQWTPSPEFDSHSINIPRTEIGFQQHHQYEGTGLSVGHSEGAASGQTMPKAQFHTTKFEPIVGHSAGSPHMDPRTIYKSEPAPNKLVHREYSNRATPLSSLNYG